MEKFEITITIGAAEFTIEGPAVPRVGETVQVVDAAGATQDGTVVNVTWHCRGERFGKVVVECSPTVLGQ